MVKLEETLEIGVLKYFLEEIKRRAENLAKSDDPTVKTFGGKADRMLSRLINMVNRAEHDLTQFEIHARANVAYEELREQPRTTYEDDLE